jgi:hypothetical protein
MLQKGYFKKANMESLYWWYTMPLQTVKGEPLLQLKGTFTVSEALRSMDLLKVTKAVVYDTTESLLGVVTLGKIQLSPVNIILRIRSQKCHEILVYKLHFSSA